jgi:hypothetical protein
MKKLLRILAVLAALSLPAFAQPAACNSATIPLCSQPVGTVDVQIKPQAVPTSTTIVSAVDAYLRSITVSNPTSSAITFLLADKQGTPIAAIPTVSVAGNSVFIAVWPAGPGYWCPAGFTIFAGGAGLTLQGAFRQ